MVKALEQVPRPQLSRGEILKAARKIARDEGLGALTTRRLSSELKVTEPAIYYYVASKQSLLEMLTDDILADIKLPERGSWDKQIVEHIISVREVFRNYPGLATYGVLHRPLPGAARLTDFVIGKFLKGGLDPATALQAFQTLTVYTLGQMVVDGTSSQVSGARKRRGKAPKFLPRALSNGVTYPSLAKVHSVVGNLDAGDTFLQGLVWFLNEMKNKRKLRPA